MDYLLVTNNRDITSDYIVREILKRGLSVHRLNTETIAEYTVHFEPAVKKFSIQNNDAAFEVGDVKAAYYRRPLLPDVDTVGVTRPEDIQYCRMEWLSLLKSLYLYLDDRWFSHPNRILLAEDKPRQLQLAKKLGFEVPGTLVSNKPESVSVFCSRGRTVGKPLKQALLEGREGERVIFTTRLSKLTTDNGAAIKAAPVIYQQEIPKRLDLRVTVVSNRAFAVGIHSQASPETTVDWRRGSQPNLEHEVVDLPPDVEGACISLVRELGLRFGAIDLILDTNNRFWFLECNPNGQWAWIENRTGLPIASAIVDELQRIASR